MSIPALLERVDNLLRFEAWRTDTGAALQPVHLKTLSYLSRANRYSNTPAGVTEYLSLTKGTASQSLKFLVQRGLLRRRPDANDRRVVHLYLTARGRRLVADSMPSAQLSHALDGMDPLTRRQLEQGLRHLLETLQAQHGGRSFGVCHSCRYFQREADGFRCGLTLEPLRAEETELICREHEAA